MDSILTDDAWRAPILGTDYIGPDRIVHFTEYLEEKSKDPHGLLHVDFPEFDKRLNGLMPGEVTVVTGKTGEGKTLFSESWMHGIMARETVSSVVFSFEVHPTYLLQKWTGFPTMPLYLPLELKAMDVEWLYERIQEAKNKFDCRLVLLDHLHFLVDMATKQNMSLNIGGFMRRLKQDIAVRLNIAVLLIAHQRGVAKGEEPSLEDVRDSTFITQEADNVIVVWRRPDFDTAELRQLGETNPEMQKQILERMPVVSSTDRFANSFEMVQIAKARRSGAFRWKKLFQKVGPVFEEV